MDIQPLVKKIKQHDSKIEETWVKERGKSWHNFFSNTLIASIREDGLRKVLDCLDRGIVKKGEICLNSGVDVRLLNSLWIDKAIQDKLKTLTPLHS